ncbi:MAG: hypothetical protein ABI459_00035 [Deltaproteobacteria bacterium]
MKNSTYLTTLRDLLAALLLVAAALMIAGTGPAHAATETINCPLTQAKREVTTAIPSDWWNTPIVNNLSGTEVAVIGGQTALICRYGSSGSVQRYAPDGGDCVASGSGFSCETASPAPPVGGVVHASGEVNLPLLGAAEFDGGGRSDVLHFLSDGIAAALIPQNGARFGHASGTSLGYAGCSGETLRNRPTVLADILGGGFICYKTNNGRIGEFEFLGLSGGTVSLAYTTWE